jgi:hypothetical protein
LTNNDGIGTKLRLILLHVVQLDNGSAAALDELAAVLNALEIKVNEAYAATFAPMPTPTQDSEDGANA